MQRVLNPQLVTCRLENGCFFKIHPNVLYRWRKEFLEDSDESFPGQGKMKASDEEVARLRREVASLREEQLFDLARHLSPVDIHNCQAQEIVIAVKRLGHSPIGGRLDISTLTYHDRGIDARFQESDQREWHVRCVACGEWQPMTIHQVVIEWDEYGRETATLREAMGPAKLAASWGEGRSMGMETAVGFALRT